MIKIESIYCDFDGTVTKTDSVNTFFEMYADKSWTYYENLWIEGKITSQENAIKQVALIQEMPKETLQKYIDSIEVDDYFIKFWEYLTKNNIKLTILSDGFDLFIKAILDRYNIKNVDFYANHLVYKNNKFSIEFPYHNNSCDIGAGMCKCEKIKEKEFCYVGDGTSDLCVAKKANLLFATKTLKKHCEQNNVKHIPFNSFKDIMDYLKNN